MSNLLPTDGYDTLVAAPASATDANIYVDLLPNGITSGVLTAFNLDGVTILEKIYFTGVTVSPPTLTGCIRGITEQPVAGTYPLTAGTGKSLPKGTRIALCDTGHYTGAALAELNGTQRTGGVLQYPVVRSINDPRHLVDKEYADALPASAYAPFMVSRNGILPTLSINVNSGYLVKADNTIAAFMGAAAFDLAPSTTSYVEMDETGAVFASGSFTAGRYPLAVVVTDPADIVSVTDARGFMGHGDGLVDRLRTWTTVQSIPADKIQVTTDPVGADDAVRLSYLQTNYFPGSAFISVCGDGSDGPLTITSGTTNIDCGGAKILVKNYTDISITGTGALIFSNPHPNGTIIFLKAIGNCELTSSASPNIDVSGLGAAGGIGATTSLANGGTGAIANFTLDLLSHGGESSATRLGGVPLNPTWQYITDVGKLDLYRNLNIICGNGGGGGGAGIISAPSHGGDGGNGGGALIMAIKGSYNQTGSIFADGKRGQDGVILGPPLSETACGGGGGGSRGSVLIIYGTLIASGTVTTNSGAGGNSSNASASSTGAGSGGGGAGSIESSGGDGGQESGGGNPGLPGGHGAGGGGAGGRRNAGGANGGGAGWASNDGLIQKNKWFF